MLYNEISSSGALPNLPDASRVVQREARQRFRVGMSFTGREVRRLFPELLLSHTHLYFFFFVCVNLLVY